MPKDQDSTERNAFALVARYPDMSVDLELCDCWLADCAADWERPARVTLDPEHARLLRDDLIALLGLPE